MTDGFVLAHPGVVFTAVRVGPRASSCGSDMIDICAVYDGDPDDLAMPAEAQAGVRGSQLVQGRKELGPERDLHCQTLETARRLLSNPLHELGVTPWPSSGRMAATFASSHVTRGGFGHVVPTVASSSRRDAT